MELEGSCPTLQSATGGVPDVRGSLFIHWDSDLNLSLVSLSACLCVYQTNFLSPLCLEARNFILLSSLWLTGSGCLHVCPLYPSVCLCLTPCLCLFCVCLLLIKCPPRFRGTLMWTCVGSVWHEQLQTSVNPSGASLKILCSSCTRAAPPANPRYNTREGTTPQSDVTV